MTGGWNSNHLTKMHLQSKNGSDFSFQAAIRFDPWPSPNQSSTASRKSHGWYQKPRILHHLGWLKPYKQWDNHHPWWCRILSWMLLTFVESDMSDVSQEWMRFYDLFFRPENKLACWVYAIRFRTSKNLNLNVIVLHGSEMRHPHLSSRWI